MQDARGAERNNDTQSREAQSTTTTTAEATSSDADALAAFRPIRAHEPAAAVVGVVDSSHVVSADVPGLGLLPAEQQTQPLTDDQTHVHLYADGAVSARAEKKTTTTATTTAQTHTPTTTTTAAKLLSSVANASAPVPLSFVCLGLHFVIFSQSSTTICATTEYKRCGLIVCRVPFGFLLAHFRKPHFAQTVLPRLEPAVQRLRS